MSADAQAELRDAVVRFAQAELNANVQARDEARQFDREGFRRCGAFGLLGLPLPEEYGGSAADPLRCATAMEALGYAAADQGLAFAVNTQLWTCAVPILRFGSAAQREQYLPALARGDLIGGHGATEAEAGSDAFATKTTATQGPSGDWRLEGTKAFVSNGPVADILIIFARTAKQRGFGDLTAFLVETKDPKVEQAPALKTMGLKTCPLGAIHLNEVVVPDSARLGEVGQGQAIFHSEMEWERACLFACHVGRMHFDLDRCVAYAKERKQFGETIGSFQAVSHRIADMRLRLEIARNLVYKVAEMKTANRRAPLESAMAKLYVSEAYVASALDAIRIHGGYGYCADYDVERSLRDAVGSVLYSGTSDIQRNMIARWLGL